MDQAVNVFEVNASTFDQVVIENSHRVPVLVDFWADWCAPCKMQLPVLLKLADEYGGKFVLAKVNTDAEGDLAAQHGIRSLPTMRLYRHGEVVEEVLGAQPEATLRALIDPYIERESDRTLTEALALADRGRPQEALALLKSASESDPDNLRLRMAYVQLSIESGDLDTAGTLLAELPADIRESSEGKALATRLEFARVTAGAPDRATLEQRVRDNPDDAEARHQLAARQVTEGRYDEALDTLMELLKRSPRYGDAAARRGLLGLFGLLGDDDERVARYRRQMFALLH